MVFEFREAVAKRSAKDVGRRFKLFEGLVCLVCLAQKCWRLME